MCLDRAPIAFSRKTINAEFFIAQWIHTRIELTDPTPRDGSGLGLEGKLLTGSIPWAHKTDTSYNYHRKTNHKYSVLSPWVGGLDDDDV